MLPHSNKDFKTQAKCHELKLQFVSLASLSPSLFENLELQQYAELSSLCGLYSGTAQARINLMF